MKHLASAVLLASLAVSLAWCTVSETNNQHEKIMFCLKAGKSWSGWSGGCK